MGVTGRGLEEFVREGSFDHLPALAIRKAEDETVFITNYK
jgi:hypothetical protein